MAAPVFMRREHFGVVRLAFSKRTWYDDHLKMILNLKGLACEKKMFIMDAVRGAAFERLCAE